MSTFISSSATPVIPIGIANLEEASAVLQGKSSALDSANVFTAVSTENASASCKVLSLATSLPLFSSSVDIPLESREDTVIPKSEVIPDTMPLNLLNGSPQASEADFVSSSILELDQSSEAVIGFLGDDCLASADLAEADCPSPPTVLNFEAVEPSNNTPFHSDNASSFENKETSISLAPGSLKGDVVSLFKEISANDTQLIFQGAKVECEVDEAEPTGNTSPTLENSPYHSGMSTNTSDGAAQRAIETLSAHSFLNSTDDTFEKGIFSNDTSHMDSSQNISKTNQLLAQTDGKSKYISTCRHWLLGKCNKGDSCQYLHRVLPTSSSSHNGGIISHPSKKSTICTYWKQGLCTKGAECRFAHVEDLMDHLSLGHSRLPPGRNTPSSHAVGSSPLGYRMELCRFRHFGCPRGFQCTDAHSIEELRPGKFTPEELRALRMTNDAVGSNIESSGRRRDISNDGGFSKAERKECYFWAQGQCKKGDRCPFLHHHTADVPPINFSTNDRFPLPRASREPDNSESRFLRSLSTENRQRLSRSSEKVRHVRSGLSRSRSRSRSSMRPTPPWASAARPWRNRKGRFENGGVLLDNSNVSDHLSNTDVKRDGFLASRELLGNSASPREMNSQYHNNREFCRSRKDGFYADSSIDNASRREYKGVESFGASFDKESTRESDTFARNKREQFSRIENRLPVYCGKGDGESDFAFHGMRRYVSGSGNSFKGEPWRY